MPPVPDVFVSYLVTEDAIQVQFLGDDPVELTYELTGRLLGDLIKAQRAWEAVHPDA